MEIRKNSWHYKLWAWTHGFWGREWRVSDHQVEANPPSLCSYVQWNFWMTLFIGPVVTAIAILGLLMLALYYMILTPVALLFGLRPIKPTDLPDGTWFEPYRGLKLGWFRLYPWHVLITYGLAKLEFWGWINHPNTALGIHIPIAVSAIFIFAMAYLHSDTGKVAREWIGAKKQGICPLITFKD